MSAKSVIQNLQDSQLIRIFLDFVQTFHLQYQKIDKQISYKCHEATWILATTKATGYGRTQSQAYKHALRNLLEILIEDPPYTQFFVNLLSSISSTPPSSSNNQPSQANYSTFNQNAQSNSTKINKIQQTNQNQASAQSKSKGMAIKPPLYSNLSASLTTNNAGYGNGNPKRQLKTQGIEHQEQIENQQQGQYEYKQSSNTNNKYGQKQRYDVNKSSNNNIYTSSYKCTPSFNHQYSGSQSSNANTGNSKKQYIKSSNSPISYYNNININDSLAQIAQNQPKMKSSTNSAYQYHQHHTGSEYDQQVKRALARNKQLLHELNSINKQNQTLKTQLYSINLSSNANSSAKNIMISSLGSHAYGHSATKGMRLSTGGSNHNTNAYPTNSNSNGTKIYSQNNSSSNNIMKDITNISANIMESLNKNSFSNKNSNMELDEDMQACSTNTNKNIPINSQTNSTINHMITSQDSIKGRPSLNSNPSNASTINPNKSKILVPKLKLEILPNYHKKAQKSLNDSLLAVYEQKHGTTHTTNNTHNSNNVSMCGGFGQGQVNGVLGMMNFNVSVNSIKKIG